MSHPIIRPFGPRDQQAVLDVILPIQREEFGIAITVDDQPDLRAIPSFYQSGRGAFLVADVDGRIVGTIGLKDIGNGQAALRKMFVVADHRGPAHGIAAALLHSLLDGARGQGVTTIYLGTTDAFLAAHRFYEKHGFRRVAPDTLPEAFPRMCVDRRFYALALTDFPSRMVGSIRQ